jgi:pantoate--beta-alanine ligase
VATIVTKLFNIVQPTNAYFGQKDAAQCVLIRRLVEDLDMDINLVIKATVRESDGLAMSSRNTYLTEEERKIAPIVYKSLCAGRALFDKLKDNECIPAITLRQAVESTLRSEPLISEIQYIAVDSKATMRTIEQVDKTSGAIISLACKVGSVRLIDNIIL